MLRKSKRKIIFASKPRLVGSFALSRYYHFRKLKIFLRGSSSIAGQSIILAPAYIIRTMKAVMHFKHGIVHSSLFKQCERFQNNELSFVDATDNAKRMAEMTISSLCKNWVLFIQVSSKTFERTYFILITFILLFTEHTFWPINDICFINCHSSTCCCMWRSNIYRTCINIKIRYLVSKHIASRTKRKKSDRPITINWKEIFRSINKRQFQKNTAMEKANIRYVYDCLEQIIAKNCSKQSNTEPNERHGCVKRNHRVENNERDKHNTKSSVFYQRIWTCAVFQKTSLNVSSVICLEFFPFSLFTFVCSVYPPL